MAAALHITLEQWRALMAVVDAGSYAGAAQLLHKSQSSVTYAVQKLESVLGVKAFEIQGRKSILTSTGRLLYRRARTLIDDAGAIEQAARRLSAGWEAEIRLAVEILFPTWLLFKCLARFAEESPHTRVELIESVLTGTTEALLQGQADLVVANSVPTGFLGDSLIRMRVILAAHPDHPLHRLGRPLTQRDLRAHRQLLVRESSSTRETRPLLETAQRWTVSHMATSIEGASMGYGFAWYPEERIREELSSGILKQLPLREGGERFVELYLIFADRDSAGPGTLRLAEIIRESVSRECARHETARRPIRAEGKAVTNPGRRQGVPAERAGRTR